MTAGSNLGTLINTTAFNMGIDCPNIHNVIHCGSPACGGNGTNKGERA